MTREDLEKRVRSWVEATYEDGNKGVPRIDVCHIAVHGIMEDFRHYTEEAHKEDK